MESHPTLEGMRLIVTLSYNHLPHELKACMMYLSIFPEDYAIRKDRLLHRWIAEGLVPEKRALTMLEVAESYYDELLSRNMTFSVKGSRDYRTSGPNNFEYDGSEDSCQVHVMLLEVMVSKSLEANFVSLLGGQYDGMSYYRVRRLSIHDGGVDSRPLAQNDGQEDFPTRKTTVGSGRGSRRGGGRSVDEDMDTQHVRSLSMFQLHGKKLLDQLGNFTLLRVLDLENCEGVENKHVRYACQLYLLKFLSLRSTKVSEMPPQISNLEHLQTLDVIDTRLGGLPETVTRLEKLERLQYFTRYGEHNFWRLPKGLVRMKALRQLQFVIFGNSQRVAQELGQLEQLQELAIFIDTNQILNAEDPVLEKLAKSLSEMRSLRSLDIREMGNNGVLKFLHKLPEPPRLLRHFRVEGDIGRQLPTWVKSLTYLIEIVLCFVQLSDDEPFGVLCKLPRLQSIMMQQGCYTGDELVARDTHSFPALINLDMFCCDQPQVYRFEPGSMPKLEKLVLEFSGYDTRVVGIQHLTSLKEAQLSGEKDDDALNRAVDQFKEENSRRQGSSQFQL